MHTLCVQISRFFYIFLLSKIPFRPGEVVTKDLAEHSLDVFFIVAILRNGKNHIKRVSGIGIYGDSSIAHILLTACAAFCHSV